MLMVKFILKRIAQLVIILLVASVLIFCMVRMSGTDPVAVILGGKQTSPETIQAVREKFGLNVPLVEQYFNWITGMLRGDFGLSFKYQQEVSSLIASRVPITLGLVFMGSVIALIIAIPLGILCAVKQGKWIDKAGSILSLILAGSPPFLTSIIMVLIVSIVCPSYPITGGYEGIGGYFERLALPALALACVMIALACRVTRSSMIEQRNAPYTQTAVAKGVPAHVILWKHNLKNAIIPVIAVVSIQMGGMVVGAVLVENVFSLSGLGTLLVDSIKASDYAIVQDITMLLIFMFLVISTIVDIVYAAIDPRIQIK